MTTSVCEKCGEVIQFGAWPFCPHGVVREVQIIGDEFPGGKTFEHLDHEPVTVYSKSELKREMDKRNLRFTDRYRPIDGPDWRKGIDPYTLESAKALVSRGVETKDDPGRLQTLRQTLQPVVMTVEVPRAD